MVILCSYLGVINLSIISVPFNKARRNYVVQYLLKTVRELEAFSTEKKCWGVNPDIIIILTKLLLNGKSLIFNGSVLESLEERIIETDFDSIVDMGIYTYAFITQTKTFINAETNNKPKIIADDIVMTRLGEVSLVHYLQAKDDATLLESIARNNAIANTLNNHINVTTPARKEILLKLLIPVITPLLVALEQIYEVLNEIN